MAEQEWIDFIDSFYWKDKEAIRQMLVDWQKTRKLKRIKKPSKWLRKCQSNNYLYGGIK